jgi:protein TilB
MMKPKIPETYGKDGRILQCNQGSYKWEFGESEDKTCITLELNVPRFMDTSTMNIDLQPLYVRCDIKGKITQLVFEEEILVERSTVQRSQTTGSLCLTMPKARINEIQARNMKYAKQREEREKKKVLETLAKDQ